MVIRSTAAERRTAPDTRSGGDVAPYSVARVTSTDIEEQAASLDGWNQVYEQMTPGPFVGKLHELRFSGVQLFRETSNQAVHECRHAMARIARGRRAGRDERYGAVPRSADRRRCAGDARARRGARLLRPARSRHPRARHRRRRAGSARAPGRASRHCRRVRHRQRVHPGAGSARRIPPGNAVGAAGARRQPHGAAVPSGAAVARADDAGRRGRRRQRRHRRHRSPRTRAAGTSWIRRRNSCSPGSPRPSPSPTCALRSA